MAMLIVLQSNPSIVFFFQIGFGVALFVFNTISILAMLHAANLAQAELADGHVEEEEMQMNVRKAIDFVHHTALLTGGSFTTTLLFVASFAVGHVLAGEAWLIQNVCLCVDTAMNAFAIIYLGGFVGLRIEDTGKDL